MEFRSVSSTAVSALSSGHWRLLSTWNVARVAEEWTLKLGFILIDFNLNSRLAEFKSKFYHFLCDLGQVI